MCGQLLYMQCSTKSLPYLRCRISLTVVLQHTPKRFTFSLHISKIMVPAAPATPTDTSSSYRSTASTNSAPTHPRSTQRTYTKTVTSTVYINASTLEVSHFSWPTRSSSASSPSHTHLAPRSPTTTTPLPVVHGIIPGSHHPASHSAPHDSPAPRTPSPFTSSPRSSYPRPSPPGFLYPFAIVSLSATQAARPPHSQHYDRHRRHAISTDRHHMASSGSTSYDASSLPPILKVLLVSCIGAVVLGLLWTVTIWLVNFPPGGWACWTWSCNIRGVFTNRGVCRERRPLDKPSRYADATGKKDTDMRRRVDEEYDMRPGTATAYVEPMWSTHDIEGIELRQRFRQSHAYSTSQLAEQGVDAASSHDNVVRSRSPRFSVTAPPTPTRSMISSPVNPFLEPPNTLLAPSQPGDVKPQPRSSSEWLVERTRFFNTAASMSMSRSASPLPVSAQRSPCLSRSPSATTSMSSYISAFDLAALESGTAPLTGHARSASLDERSSHEGVVRRSLSWLDQGLGMVDGVVGRVANELAKWTNDDDEEGLPVVR